MAPLLAEAVIHTVFDEPESGAPDDAYHMGPCPGTLNDWVAAGFNSISI